MKKAHVLLAFTCILSLCLSSCSLYETSDQISGSSADGSVTYEYKPNDFLVIQGNTTVSRPLSSSDIPEQIALRVKYIELGSGITALGSGCLAHFERLEFIRISQAVTFIESDVFNECPNNDDLVVWFDIEQGENGTNGYSYALNESSDYRRYWAMKYAAECQALIRGIKENGGRVCPADHPSLPFNMLYDSIDAASSESGWLALDLQRYPGSVTDFAGPVARKVKNLTLNPNQSFMNLMDWEWEALDDFQIYELSLPDTVTSITAEIIEILHSGAPENLRIYYWGTRDEWNTLTSGWDVAVVSQWEVYTSDDY